MKPIRFSNIFDNLSFPEKGESFETLLKEKKLTIERILSTSIIEKEVMIQEEDEWCIMIEGEATLLIAGQKRHLKRGDYCFIPAQTAHRVLDVKEKSIWLALHF